MKHSRAGVANLEPLTIEWGTRKVTASLHRTSRRVLRIAVDPTGAVDIFVPREADLEEVLTRSKRKSAWIFREIDQISARPTVTTERRFLSGETHLFLGRQYRLALETAREPFVRIDGARLVIGARDPNDTAHCRRLLTAFYSIEAKHLFPARLEAVLPPFERKGMKRPHLIIRRMSKRWGSFTPAGNITLNVDLIKAGPALIDYVICHELAHAFYSDHNEEWQNLLTSVLPDWQMRKQQLETILR